jgi:fibronectin type 3 domain-containing protein
VSVGANVRTYADTGAVAGVTYRYRVRAFGAGGDSAYSNTVTITVAAPAAPATLTATVATGPRVNLAWRDNSANETGFQIYRATGSSSTFARIASLGRNATAFADTTVAANTTYRYRVRAYNGAGTSSYSNTVTVKTGG